MKGTFLYLIIMHFGVALSGQTVDPDTIFEPKLCGEIFRMKTGTIGEQFYNVDWAVGDIKLNTGEMAVKKLLKYNAFMDELIWLQTDSLWQVKLEKHFIDEFCLRNYYGRSVLFRRIRLKLPRMTDTADVFLEVLTEKNASLYVFRNVIIQGTVNRVIGGIQYSFNKLVPQPEYILILPGGGRYTFKKIGRIALLKALPEDYRAVVNEIIRQNNLSLMDENDLVKLTDLID